MKAMKLTKQFYGTIAVAGIILTTVSNKVNAQANSTASFFTGGTAEVVRMTTNADINCGVSKVTFPPGVRTVWHKHAGGQVIVVTQGTAWYQEKGKPKQVVKQGEAVVSSPNVEHWHGATPEGIMSHTVATPNLDKGGATAGAPVSDEEYRKVN